MAPEVRESRGPRSYKRPESVLVVVYTRDGEVLLLERREPPGYWQSITGSLEPGEGTLDAARREVREEIGYAADGRLRDRHVSNRFAIHPAWRRRFAPGTTHNTEHVFTLELEQRCPVRLNPGEHVGYAWLARAEAAVRADSYTNRDAIIACVATARKKAD